MLETLLYPGVLGCTFVHMSENLSGAGNQQERLCTSIPSDLGHYIAGFSDGEGSFNISFRPRHDYRLPWKISACFNISQKERPILDLCQQTFGCGTLRSRPDGIWYFEVNTLGDILQFVIPFFYLFPFRSEKKKKDFSLFCSIVNLLKSRVHHSSDGIQKILDLRRTMNGGGKRKYSEQQILDRLYKESSETIRQTPRSSG
jgi:hypothetical protein